MRTAVRKKRRDGGKFRPYIHLLPPPLLNPPHARVCSAGRKVAVHTRARIDKGEVVSARLYKVADCTESEGKVWVAAARARLEFQRFSGELGRNRVRDYSRVCVCVWM